MTREEILKSFNDLSFKDRYINHKISFYDQVDLICPSCGKVYTSTYGNRFNKEGEVKRTLLCKSCASSKNRTINPDPESGTLFGELTFIRRIEDIVSPSGKSYIQYLCKCSCGREIKVRKDNLIKGKTTRCSECKTKFLTECSHKRGDNSDPPVGTVFGHLTFLNKVYLEDSYGRKVQYYHCKCDCGSIIDIAKSSILQGLSTSCGCYGSRNKLREKRIHIGEETDPSIGSRFGKLTVLNIIPPPIGGEKKIECLCECGNIIVITKHSLLNGRYKTCGHCPCVYPQWFLDKLIDPIQKEKAINGTLTTQDIVEIKCANCGKHILRKVNCLINLTTQEPKRVGFCSKCSHHTSKEEKEILDFLKSLGLRDDQILTNTRQIIKDIGRKTKELDFYLPNYKLAIEYNGSYFHSDQKKPKNYHLEKFNLCEGKGIRLISIFEMDWNNSKEKLKDLIKYNIIPKQKIHARKCIVRFVSEQQAFDFYDTYHIQNKSTLAKINIGLYYNEDLVAVMGFGSSYFHNRKNNEGDYELHRFVTKSGFTIVGGASKLLSFFEQEFKPHFLLSYSWNDWFDGKLYSKLGFSLDHIVPPDYYWYYKGECINKRKCRLKNLQVQYPSLFQEALDNNASNKENYVMEKLGAVKVYRSGAKRWVKQYE